MPLVSVIVPVYKAEAYLHKCVDSLLAQTMTDFEVLLIDDGSPDRSGEICDEYAAKDSRIRVFHKENGGVSSARNLGLDNAQGEWVSFVDSDDWVEVDYLLNLTKNLDADMVLSGLKGTNGSVFSCENFFWDVHNMGECLNKYAYNIILGGPTANLLKKCIIDKYNLRFDSIIRYGEDTIFNRNYILHCNSIRTISAVNYNFIVSLTPIAKYNLNFNEIDYICEQNTQVIKKISDKFNVYIDSMIFNFFQMGRLRELSKYNIDALYNLCKKYYPLLTEKDFFSNSLVSPIMYGFNELKILYEQKKYDEAKKYFYCLSNLCREKCCCIENSSVKRRIMLYLIKKEQWFIFDVLMKMNS